MPGFFTPTIQRPPPSLIPKCGVCGLHKHCLSPKMPVSGKGRKGILVVAEAPGGEEDKQGTQLVGRDGQRLRRELFKFDIDLDEDCWKTNAINCRPEDNKTPTDKQVLFCRPMLHKTIKKLKPRLIILLGGATIKSLIGSIWKESVGAVARWVGWKIPCQKLNSWICPTYHPSDLLSQNDPALDLWFEHYLEVALELKGRPFEDVPDYRKRVEVIHSPSEAAHRITKVMSFGMPVAFDYETNMLKPDCDEARIVSCSVAWGNFAIAYPWHGDAIKATGELLKSEIPKIGWNQKFEERWTQKQFGHGVNRWMWCGMSATHILDNRRKITSLKFQSFVQLGQGVYDEEVGPFLKGESNKPNRIHEVNLDKLLLYGGLDALLACKIAAIQRGKMGGN